MKTLLALFALLLLAGCSSVTSTTAPGVDLTRYQRVWVERRLNENHHVDEFMAEELRRLGYQADSGPLTMMPKDTDIVVYYDGRWTWDFTTYLIDLGVEVRMPHSQRQLAIARFYQPSARPKSAEDVARALIGRLFGPAAAKNPPAAVSR